MRRLVSPGLLLVLFACTQELGGIHGDPPRNVRASLYASISASASPIVRAMAAEAETGQKPAREPMAAGPQTITVGPNGLVKSIAEAAELARDGDTVEVQAGEYRGDVALWHQKRLTIRAVGGRAVLIADGSAVEGKGIWVIRNGDFEIDGFDFIGARVPAKNGAGIRFEHGNLVVRNCRFIANENGILTSNDGISTMRIERSLFERNGHGDGYSHGVYAGRIARLEVRESWFRDGNVGQLLKSRARDSIIEHNRLVDERGNSSYELEFPNGGRARVIGNIIAQSPRTENRVIVSFGVEGYKWPENRLVMTGNMLVDLRPQSGTFVRVSPGNASAALTDNLWIGKGGFELKAETTQSGNQRAITGVLLDPAAGDYRVRRADLARLAPEPPPLPPAWVERYPIFSFGAAAQSDARKDARSDASAAETVAVAPAVPARTLRVGPGRELRTIAQAAREARSGDIVEVEAGEYRGDVAVWPQKHLTIRAVGGRAALHADGKAAEGKAIWVIRDGDFEIEGFDFVGTRVSSGNGAGIRFEDGQLIVRDSRFIDNQTGLMTGNKSRARLLIDRCEISGPDDGMRPYHNLRIGRIDRFELRNSTLHRARTGNLVQTRAMHNFIIDNQLIDGPDGRASYELDIPDGGLATVSGNRIEQSPNTENLIIVSFGTERYYWPQNELRMSHNTLVNLANGDALFVRVVPGPTGVHLERNILLGPGRMLIPDSADQADSHTIRQ